MPRPSWDALEPALRADIERLVGDRIVDARSCAGGFSPGFASRLSVAGGGQVFVKAIDAVRWPHEVAAYRDEIRANAALPPTAPAPAFLGAIDAGRLDPWPAANLSTLVDLERRGLRAARGDALVHGDLYPHNILLTPDRVVIVDWPHARLGSPVVDLVTVLTSAAADGLDPERALRRHAAHVPPADVDAVLAAHAGFLVSGGLAAMPPGLQPIAAQKRRLGTAAVGWLRARSRISR